MSIGRRTIANGNGKAGKWLQLWESETRKEERTKRWYCEREREIAEWKNIFQRLISRLFLSGFGSLSHFTLIYDCHSLTEELSVRSEISSFSSVCFLTISTHNVKLTNFSLQSWGVVDDDGKLKGNRVEDETKTEFSLLQIFQLCDAVLSQSSTFLPHSRFHIFSLVCSRDFHSLFFFSTISQRKEKIVSAYKSDEVRGGGEEVMTPLFISFQVRENCSFFLFFEQRNQQALRENELTTSERNWMCWNVEKWKIIFQQEKTNLVHTQRRERETDDALKATLGFYFRLRIRISNGKNGNHDKTHFFASLREEIQLTSTRNSYTL